MYMFAFNQRFGFLDDAGDWEGPDALFFSFFSLTSLGERAISPGVPSPSERHGYHHLDNALAHQKPHSAAGSHSISQALRTLT